MSLVPPHFAQGVAGNFASWLGRPGGIFSPSEDTVKIGAVLPYYGCKRTIGPKIIRQMMNHRVYWELFCGSLSILFAKDRCAYETVNDLHADLYNLTTVLQCRGTAEMLYGKVSRTLFHEDLLPLAKSHLQNPCLPDPVYENVDRAYWYLVFSWMGLNGVSGTPLASTGTFALRFTQGGNGPVRWGSVGDSIPEWHQRLQRVQILNRNAFDLLPRIEDVPETVIYCDPPYIEKSSKYVHDLKAEEHAQLASQLRRFKHARVLVSYYAHPILDELYPGWERLEIKTTKGMANSSKLSEKGAVRVTEILLINGPIVPPEAPDLFEEVPQ